VTGGNVSFYNQTGATAINPTPVIGVLGVLEDVRRRVPSGFVAGGDRIVLLGRTEDELDGSAWAWVVHRHLGGRPPAVRLGAERALAELLRDAAQQSMVASAHDLSEGGLAQALVEACLIDGVGARVDLVGDGFVELFSESAARALVTTRNADAIVALADSHGVTARVIGETGGDSLVVSGQFEVGLSELRERFEATLPALFG
jgi:phosphoribosylformylglycinamidine synthase